MFPPRIIASLDDILAPGAEELLISTLDQGLLHGVAIGVLRDGQFLLRLVGKDVTRDSRFQIGSLTKVYTAELLAILVNRGIVSLDDPLAKFLPTGRDPGPLPITLRDLATHRSGLPRLPPGMPLTANPYAKYSAADLENYLLGDPLQLAPEQTFLYSNLGYSVLGYVLSQATGTSFSDLLDREILHPLGLDHTTLAMEGTALPKLLPGHTGAGLPSEPWTFDACAPCGALCSTVEDQLKFLAWLLNDPNRLALQTQALIPLGEIGLAWIIRAGGRSCWHNGATVGFSSWISLNRDQRTGLVILSNRQAISQINTLGSRFEAT